MDHRKDGENSFLDIGCGTGRLLGIGNIPNFVGIDLSRKFIRHLNGDHINVAVMSAESLGFRGRSFDVAVMMDICHHLSDSMVAVVLDEAKRIATKRIVIIDIVKMGCNPFRNLLHRMDRGKYLRTFQELYCLIDGCLSVDRVHVFRSGLQVKCYMAGKP